MGAENDNFWSETGTGFGEPGGKPPPRNSQQHLFPTPYPRPRAPVKLATYNEKEWELVVPRFSLLTIVHVIFPRQQNFHRKFFVFSSIGTSAANHSLGETNRMIPPNTSLVKYDNPVLVSRNTDKKSPRVS